MNTAEDYVRHALERLRNVEGFDKVRFIILYGSVAEGRAKETSDIDLCIYYDGTRDEGQLLGFGRSLCFASTRKISPFFSITKSISTPLVSLK